MDWYVSYKRLKIQVFTRRSFQVAQRVFILILRDQYLSTVKNDLREKQMDVSAYGYDLGRHGNRSRIKMEPFQLCGTNARFLGRLIYRCGISCSLEFARHNNTGKMRPPCLLASADRPFCTLWAFG